MNSREDKIKGIMYGVALGDYLGTKLESGTARITDDTCLTLAVLRGALKDLHNPEENIFKEFVKWLQEDGYGVGGITKIALEEGSTVDNWDYGAKQAHETLDGRSAGNGSLMRTAPIGFLYRDLRETLAISGSVSNITHYDIKAKEACQLYTWLIYLLVAGRTREEALKEVVDYHLIYGEYLRLEKKELKTSAYVEDTLITSLWCFSRSTNFQEGILESISLGGDRDTIGAVTGGLLGAWFGFSNLNEQFANQLDEDLRTEIDRLIMEVK